MHLLILILTNSCIDTEPTLRTDPDGAEAGTPVPVRVEL